MKVFPKAAHGQMNGFPKTAVYSIKKIRENNTKILYQLNLQPLGRKGSCLLLYCIMFWKKTITFVS